MPRRRRNRAPSSPSRREGARGRAPQTRSRRSRPKPPSLLLRVGPAQVACIDAIRADLRAAGGPGFTRRQVALAILESTLGRRFALRNVRTLDQLRVALGALDLSDIERKLRERPRIESGLLDALEDTIK